MEWKFDGSGPVSTTALTGCAEPFDEEAGSWPVHVGNRLPYALLLRLPNGVAAPGFTDSFFSLEIEDILVSMLWGLEGYTVLPAGEDVRVTVGRDAGSTVQIDGYADATTLAVKALGLITAAFSRRSTSAARIEFKAAIKAKQDDNRRIVAEFDRFDRERRRGDTSYTIADLAQESVPDSEVARRLRRAGGISRQARPIGHYSSWPC